MAPARAIADEPDWEEITTLSQFRERVGYASGDIVIHDVATDQPIAHHRECPFIREEHFILKVLDGAGHNGRYYWAKTSRIARAQLSASTPASSSPAPEARTAPGLWPRCGACCASSQPKVRDPDGSESADGRGPLSSAQRRSAGPIRPPRRLPEPGPSRPDYPR